MKKQIIFILITLLISSCVKENVIPQNEAVTTRSLPTSVLRYENPYSLANMQAAVNDLNPNSSLVLQPTDLYVRFQPVDSTDLRILLDLDLELFDYPIGHMLSENGEMTIPPKDTNSFLYTTVKVNFQFPDVYYEIIEECYIPSESAGTAGSTDFAKGVSQEDLEQQALYRVGVLNPPKEAVTKGISRRTPSGTIYARIPERGSMGVMNVRVRCHNFVKIGRGFTNGYGEYEMNRSFITDAYYSISFKNEKGFVIWDHLINIRPARHNVGWKANSGGTFYIERTDPSWESAVINNATCAYYDVCESYEISLPPNKLKIMQLGIDSHNGAAPMMRRISLPQYFSFNDGWSNFFGNIGLFSIITPLLEAAKWLTPDVLITGNDRDYESLFSLTGHELAHTSHFSQVGEVFWNSYISYIISHGAYGQRTDLNSGVCEVGEMWAYFFEDIFLAERLNQAESLSLPDYWFANSISALRDLREEELLNITEIFNAFTSDVKSVNALRQKMGIQNPSESTYIDIIFAHNDHYTRNNIWSIVNESSNDLLINVVRPFQQIGRYPVDFGRPQRAFGSISIGEADQISINAVDFKIGDTIQIAMLPNKMDNFIDIINNTKITPSKVVISNEDEDPLQIWTPTSSIYNQSKWQKDVNLNSGRSVVTWIYKITDDNLD